MSDHSNGDRTADEPKPERLVYKRNNPETHRAYKQKYRKGDPLKRAAHDYIDRAVRNGWIIRPARCSDCGVQCRPEGHHPDYTRKGAVIWLCRLCHVKAHKSAPKETTP